MTGPLKGFRVLDIGHAMVGPWAAMLLGSMGAEVIKVETPQGDIARVTPPLREGLSVVYIHPNLNKKATVFDLKTPEDLSVVRQLALASDVLVENMRPGTAERLGLGYDSVAELNPLLVYCSASAWGRSGPMSGVGGVDPTVQAFCGLPSITGRLGEERPELFRHFAQIDANTSCYIAAALLEGLLVRERTGKGLKVDATMLGAAMQLQATRLAEYFTTGIRPKPIGNESATTAPHQAFLCSDKKYLAIGVEHEEHWVRFCDALQITELVSDPLFSTNPNRVRNKDELTEKLASIFGSKPQRHWIVLLERVGIPCGGFADFETLKSSAQVLDNRYIIDLDTETHGRLFVGGIPWAFEKNPAEMKRGGSPGEHTEEIRRISSSIKCENIPSGRSELEQALEGLVVVELTQGIPGPYCGMLLADAGARVIKVEPPTGDFYRQAGPPFIRGDGAGFTMINRGKKSIVLDPEKDEDVTTLHSIIATADVVLEDRASGRSNDFNLGAEGARNINPSLIHCGFSGYGEQGPLAYKPGSELVAQAASEYWTSLGSIGDAPERWGADAISTNTGVFGYQAVLGCLLVRFATGSAQSVGVSLLGTALHMRGVMWAAITNPDEWFGLHCDSYTKKREHGYQTKDLGIYFALRRGSEEDYIGLLAQLGMDEALTDPRFGDGGRQAVGLGRYAVELKPVWERAFSTWSADQLIDLIKSHNGEAVPINDYDSLMKHPQVKALNLVTQLHSDDGDLVKILRVPWDFSRCQKSPVCPAPLLGQHTKEFCSGNS